MGRRRFLCMTDDHRDGGGAVNATLNTLLINVGRGASFRVLG